MAAGRSGANIAFIACTGDDSIGESVRQQLATDNIDITPGQRDQRRINRCGADFC